MRVLGFGPVLDVDVIVHHARFQRSRTEQRHQRDNVVEAVGFELFDQLLHAPRFELEYGGSLGVGQQLVRIRIIPGDGRYIDQRLAQLLVLGVNVLQGPIDNGQRAQSQKVELDQADRFDVVLVELGDQVIAVLVAIQRRKIGQLGR